MTSREKFEAWYLENWGCTEDNHDSLFEESPHGGEYYRFGVRLAWDSWQAASKASEQQLEESRREFRAADATIHNLELQLTDQAVQLTNAESKCRELSSKAMELVCEASLVYSKYNDTQMPDRDLVDMQTLQEMHDLCKGEAQ